MKSLILVLAVILGLASMSASAKDFTDYKLYSNKDYTCILFDAKYADNTIKELPEEMKSPHHITISEKRDYITVDGDIYQYHSVQNGKEVYQYISTRGENKGQQVYFELAKGRLKGEKVFMDVEMKVYTWDANRILTFSGHCANLEKWIAKK